VNVTCGRKPAASMVAKAILANSFGLLDAFLPAIHLILKLVIAVKGPFSSLIY
jgi:hypothetical protein